MGESTADFAETYSKMSDRQLAQIAADEKPLVPEAREALRAELDRRGQAPQANVGVNLPADPLVGVRGWLWWWCFGTVLGALLQLRDAPAIDAGNPVSIVVVVLFYGALVFGIVTGICVWTVASFALRLVLINFLILFGIIVLLLLKAIVMLFGPTELAGPAGELIGQALLWSVPVIIWFRYFQVSKRVRATFGKNMVLFSRKKRPMVQYTDAGVAFTYKLITSFNLGGWNQVIPVYNQSESEAIQAKLNGIQQMANAEGGEVVFHPDVVEKLQRQFGAEALKDLAGGQWRFDGQLPANWRERVSTYLKAWAMNLDPMVFIELSELLALASRKAEAKEAAEIVVNCFPSYAPRFFGGADADNSVTNQLVASAREIIQRL